MKVHVNFSYVWLAFLFFRGIQAVWSVLFGLTETVREGGKMGAKAGLEGQRKVSGCATKKAVVANAREQSATQGETL
ncbi:hypothetical protein J3F84DRAFT_363272 [Trichoderma pleuroticola]